MPLVKRKAFAYITHGDRLLVFGHPLAPEAGIQVPAGTIEDGERPENAAVREAREETGLGELALVRFLGEHERAVPGAGGRELHHRFFYHLRCVANPPEAWRNVEMTPSDGGEDRPLFEFFWARLPDGVPPLVADHDLFLSVLIEHLRAEGSLSL